MICQRYSSPGKCSCRAGINPQTDKNTLTFQRITYWDVGLFERVSIGAIVGLASHNHFSLQSWPGRSEFYNGCRSHCDASVLFTQDGSTQAPSVHLSLWPPTHCLHVYLAFAPILHFAKCWPFWKFFYQLTQQWSC